VVRTRPFSCTPGFEIICSHFETGAKSGLICSNFKVEQISTDDDAPAGHLRFLNFPLLSGAIFEQS
jgi:hypothetical protein